jgi:hypothetical protein
VASQPQAPNPNPAQTPGPTQAPQAVEKADKVDKLAQKARTMIIEGHARAALDLLKKAQKLHPKDPSLRVYEAQATGKLGHADLFLDGKGSVTIDGHKFIAPKHIKLPAGPHSVETADGESELQLKRGEKKHFRVKR